MQLNSEFVDSLAWGLQLTGREVPLADVSVRGQREQRIAGDHLMVSSLPLEQGPLHFLNFLHRGDIPDFECSCAIPDFGIPYAPTKSHVILGVRREESLIETGKLGNLFSRRHIPAQHCLPAIIFAQEPTPIGRDLDPGHLGVGTKRAQLLAREGVHDRKRFEVPVNDTGEIRGRGDKVVVVMTLECLDFRPVAG